MGMWRKYQHEMSSNRKWGSDNPLSQKNLSIHKNCHHRAIHQNKVAMPKPTKEGRQRTSMRLYAFRTVVEPDCPKIHGTKTLEIEN